MTDIQPIAQPFTEARTFWADKIRLKPSEYGALEDDAKARAFAVSGVAKADQLETMYNSLGRVIDGGATFADFKKDCAAIAEKRGWGTFRLETIFRTNVQTAFMVGRYGQVQKAAKFRPYGQYSAVGDKRTRPAHAALNGRVFPLASAFWDTWWPPNGFKCRCTVKTLSERQVKARGLKVETDDPTGKLFEPVDPKTGNKLPARLLMADPGFAHNPGKSVYGGMVDAAVMDNPKPLEGLKGPSDYKRRKLGNVAASEIGEMDASMLLPKGKSDHWYIEQFKGLYGEEQVVRDACGEPVILSLRSFMANKTPGQETYKFGKAGHGEMIPLLKGLVENPYEVWLTPQRDASGRIRLTKRYIGLWKTDEKDKVGGMAVFETYRGVLQGVTSFLPETGKGKPDLKYVERQREGLLLFPKKRAKK